MADKIFYLVKVSSRARHMRIVVSRKGATVTIPKWGSFAAAEVFVRKKTKWIMQKLKYFEKYKDNILIKRGSRSDYIRNKEQARQFVCERLTYFNQFYSCTWKRVAIKNAKRVWGSCSKRGNLNFNYRIIYLPLPLADYIIVHELCHLKELNHSKQFWNLVAKTMPEYKKTRYQLKRIFM